MPYRFLPQLPSWQLRPFFGNGDAPHSVSTRSQRNVETTPVDLIFWRTAMSSNPNLPKTRRLPQWWATQHLKRRLSVRLLITMAFFLPARAPYSTCHTETTGQSAPLALHLFAHPLLMPGNWQCPHPSCKKTCRSPGGLTQHLNTKHKHHEKFGMRDKPLLTVSR